MRVAERKTGSMVGCWVELVAPGDRIGLLEWEEILGVGEVASEE